MRCSAALGRSRTSGCARSLAGRRLRLTDPGRRFAGPKTTLPRYRAGRPHLSLLELVSRVDLVGRDLLSVADLSAAEVELVFATATLLKAEFRAHRRHAERPLVGRTLAMLFQKPSLRTRVTFDAGMAQLGGNAMYLTNDTVLGARESVRDVARNLERFVWRCVQSVRVRAR